MPGPKTKAKAKKIGQKVDQFFNNLNKNTGKINQYREQYEQAQSNLRRKPPMKPAPQKGPVTTKHSYHVVKDKPTVQTVILPEPKPATPPQKNTYTILGHEFSKTAVNTVGGLAGGSLLLYGLYRLAR